MAILITGATGTIGRVLADSLADAGLRVHVLTRRPHRVVEYFGERVHGFEWHPINEPVPAAAMNGVDTIVHLMGDPLCGAATADKMQRVTRSRLVSTQRLAEVAQGQKIRFILASSAGIYPAHSVAKAAAKAAIGPTGEADASEQKPVDGVSEETLLGKSELTGALQRSIAQWEQAADPFRAAGGAVVAVRLGRVMCRDGFPGSLLTWRQRRLIVQLNDDAPVPAISLADAVALFAWLIVNPAIDGVVNGVAPTPLTGRIISAALADLDAARKSVTMPAWLSRRALGLEADLILQRPLIMPQRLLQQGFSFTHPDLQEHLYKVLAQYKSGADYA